MTETATDTELFNTQQYEVPFPKADGKTVTSIYLRLAGTIELNRNDPAHTAFVEALTLGRYLPLQVLASVDGKHQTLKVGADDTEVVGHHVTLRIHQAEPA